MRRKPETKEAMATVAETDVAAWIRRCIEGSGGMNDYEEHEFVVWHAPERIAAASWIIRCLANPDCEGSAEVMDAILRRRAHKMREALS